MERAAIAAADEPLREAVALSARGTLLDRLGRSEEAVRDQQRALDILREVKGADHPQIGVLQHNLGNALLGTAELERARLALDDALAIFERSVGPLHSHVAEVQGSLALLHEALGDRPRAIRHADAAIESGSPTQRPRTAAPAHYNLGTLLLKNGRSEDALAEFEEAQRLFLEQSPSGGPDTIYPLHGIGEALLAMNRPGDAILRLEEARELASAHDEQPQLRAFIDISARQGARRRGWRPCARDELGPSRD